MSPALESEIKTEVKNEDCGVVLKSKQNVNVEAEVKKEESGIMFKPRQDVVAKSAAQIIHEQRGK